MKSKKSIKFNLKDEKCFSLPLSKGFLKTKYNYIFKLKVLEFYFGEASL